MTVKELIKQLDGAGDDLTVIIRDRCIGACNIHSVEYVNWPKDAENGKEGKYILLL